MAAVVLGFVLHLIWCDRLSGVVRFSVHPRRGGRLVGHDVHDAGRLGHGAVGLDAAAVTERGDDDGVLPGGLRQ